MSTVTLPATGTWTIDPAHSAVGFSVRHLMAAKVRGSFKTFSGSIDINDLPETSSVKVSIDAASIDSGAEDRDNHLRSADFLDVESHPTLSFESTAVRSVDGAYQVDGTLTIRGVAKPVTLEMQYSGVIADPWGNDKAIFSATTQINREDFGLVWNAPLEAGGVLVGKQVTIELEIQAGLS